MNKTIFTIIGIVACAALYFILWKIGIEQATIIKIVGALAAFLGLGLTARTILDKLRK